MALSAAQNQTLIDRLGSDLTMPISGDFTPIAGLPLVIQDIQQLLLTVPGERVMRPTYGCQLRNQIWENIDSAAVSGAASITTAINSFEPRVNLVSVNYNINRNTDLILFYINFVVINTNISSNLIFPLRAGTAISFA